MSAAGWFLDANRGLSRGFGRVTRSARGRGRLESLYVDSSVEAIANAARPDPLVVDVGGGRTLRYEGAEVLREAWLVGVDIDEVELLANTSVDEYRVADASKRLPFEDGAVDVLTSSSTLEHLPDVAAFFAEAARVMKPGAVMVHILPSAYAPFSVLNRLLPERLKARLLRIAYQQAADDLGFPAFYRGCYYGSIVRECERAGFQVETASVDYFGSSGYFSIFFPAFVVVRLWEILVAALGVRNLASQIVVVARRA